jgi:hypothetical protein
VDQTELLIRVGKLLDSLPARYAVVGSIASTLYAEPRLTLDIDIVVELEDRFVEPLCSHFPAPEYYASVPAARDAVWRRSQFNVQHIYSGIKIDFMISKGTAWSETQLNRTRRLSVGPNSQVSVAAPEDVILGKLWYYAEGGSDKHLRDITSMLNSDPTIDRADITAWAKRMDTSAGWEAILKRLANP